MNIFELIDAYEANPENFLHQYQSETLSVYVPKNGGSSQVAIRNIEVRRRLNAGENYAQVAIAFGMSERRVRQIERSKKILK